MNPTLECKAGRHDMIVERSDIVPCTHSDRRHETWTTDFRLGNANTAAPVRSPQATRTATNAPPQAMESFSGVSSCRRRREAFFLQGA